MGASNGNDTLPPHLQRSEDQIPPHPRFPHILGSQTQGDSLPHELGPTVHGQPNLPQATFLLAQVMVDVDSAFDELEDVQGKFQLHGQ
ncbi:MAG: hypothetical protein ACON4R_17440 [Akkermansiaceae bacterium]